MVFGFLSSRSTDALAHVAARDRALCIPLDSSEALSAARQSITSLGSLHAEEVGLQHGDDRILSSDISSLTSGIKAGTWTSTQVLHAFIRSARRAQIKTNCLTEVNFQAALQRAKELDEAFERTGQLVGPLHGIPTSFKDQFAISGLGTTLGYSAWTQNAAKETEAALVQAVRSLGGIPLCKTNVPQTMLAFECRNPLWGRTLNPWSRNHTCGGSSGGEAALLALDGAALGFGSDIGGSLRIPTGYCGIYAIKPSPGRFPSTGTDAPMHGFDGIAIVVAPMTRSAKDLEVVTREVLPLFHPSPEASITPSDAQRKLGSEILAPIPVRATWFDPLTAASQRSPLRRTLRIGYYVSDGFTKTSPACVRGVQEAVSALEAAYGDAVSSSGTVKGPPRVEMVPIEPSALRTGEAMKIFLGLTSSDGFDQLLAPLKQGRARDRMDPSLYVSMIIARLPAWLRRIVVFLIKYVLRDHAFWPVAAAAGRKSAAGYFSFIHQKQNFKKAWEARIWDEYELDGLICPVQAVPAVPHGGCTKLSALAASTILYNVLDSAVCVLPVTKVDSVKDALPPHGRQPSKANAAEHKKWKEWDTVAQVPGCSTMIARETYAAGLYDAKAMAGLPVSIQVVTRPYEDEKAIGLMRLVDEALNEAGTRHGFGPGSSL